MNNAILWLQQGEFDLESAFALFDAKLWQNACLFAQQATEKFCKSILVYADIPLWNTHDIKLLLDKAESADILRIEENQQRLANRMTQDYLGFRYPRHDSERPPFTLYDSVDAVDRLQGAMNFYDMACHLLAQLDPTQRRDGFHLRLKKIQSHPAEHP